VPKTPTPPTPDLRSACTCGRLRRASRALTRYYDAALEATGLRVTQYSLLSTLARSGPTRITDFAESALVERTAIGRMLETLADRGYVAIRPGNDDARTREAAITREGRAALAAARSAWKRAQEEVERRIGRARLDTLIGTLAELESLHAEPPAPTRRKETT
jgi:DNA-binding MarR family transcriptional regulator